MKQRRDHAQLGSDHPRVRRHYAALLRRMILRFDVFCLTVETVSQIRKLQAAWIIPR